MTSLSTGHRLPTETIAAIKMNQIEAYTAVSGDDNPIHRNRDLALEIGLDGIPVPGMLIMARISNFVNQWQHCVSIRKLHARFVHPVIVESGVIIEARIVALSSPGQSAVLRVVVSQKEKIAIMAEVVVALRQNSPGS